jgi:hypothetical protein
MAGNRSIDDYGGVRVDKSVVTNPTTQCAANHFDRLIEDAAQLTRTSTKVDVRFQTTATAGPVAVTVVSGQTQWGTGSGLYPTISKTATGTYVATYGATQDDGLVGTAADAISEVETVAFEYASGEVMANNDGTVRCTVSANVITIYVRTGGALSDLGGGIDIWVTAK